MTTLHSFFSPSAESECSSLPLLQGTRKRGTASSGGFTELESAASLQDSASLYPGKKACFQRPTLSPSSGSTNMSGSQVKNGVKPGFKPLLGASPGSNSAKPKQAKKLVIKNLKVQSESPSSYGEDTWCKLKDSVCAIYEERPISLTLNELYQAVENCCACKMASSLYERLKSVCEEHVVKLLPFFTQQYDDEMEFLTVVRSKWTVYCQQMLLIRGIFLYLDRTYVVQNTGILPIWDLGLRLFATKVVLCGSVKTRLMVTVLGQIQKERAGDVVDRSLLRDLVHMLIDSQLYQGSGNFEERFLHETREAYHAEGSRMVNSEDFTLPVYLEHIQRRLQQEEDRVGHYLDDTTRKPLVLCLENELIEKYKTQMVDKGLDNLLELSRFPDLQVMYQLFSRVHNGREALCSAFSSFVKKTGGAVVSDVERDKTMIEDLLGLKEKVDLLVVRSFEDEPMFVRAVKDGFEHAVNRRQNKPAELLAKFLDSQLRSGNKEWTDEELEKLLDRVLILFRFIHGKDVFEAFYKKDLSKRLLVGKSASADAEKSMLLKLKQECGAHFTSKLEGMFRDIEVSKDLMTSFKQHTASRSLPGSLDIYVNVLTMGYWPTYPPMTVVIPEEMDSYLTAFKTFYLSKHSGRKLSWQPNLGYCQLKAVFDHGEKELQVSFFQTLVLLLFNNADRLTYVEIKQMTNIEDGELQRTLQSLALGKARVLLKHPKGKEVASDDRFTFNREFKYKLYKIKINQVQMKETVEENQATNERVFQDRQYQVDAAVVRIMKMRKTLAHNLLIAECFEQLRFPVKPSDLKRRIESLIERDYMKRDDNNSQMYHYVA